MKKLRLANSENLYVMGLNIPINTLYGVMDIDGYDIYFYVNPDDILECDGKCYINNPISVYDYRAHKWISIRDLRYYSIYSRASRERIRQSEKDWRYSKIAHYVCECMEKNPDILHKCKGKNHINIPKNVEPDMRKLHYDDNFRMVPPKNHISDNLKYKENTTEAHWAGMPASMVAASIR